ncbi:MAG: hypothetical protein M3151_08090 [Actinomycetota bacterium]|nr:hypothetical protein [Actinomycetota bacterium]
MSLLLVWLFAGLGLLTFLQARHVRKVKRERGGLFDEVEHLFFGAEVHQDGINYPKLTGEYRGYPIKLEPVVDSLTFRKLPVLWLVSTHHRPLNVAAPLDILLRPAGTEFFSPNSDYQHDLPLDADWPEHVRAASPSPAGERSVSAFKPFLPFIANPDTKDVLVTNRGVRLVSRLAESDQALYRVTRRMDLGRVELTEERLVPLLDALVGIGDVFAGPKNVEKR